DRRGGRHRRGDAARGDGEAPGRPPRPRARRGLQHRMPRPRRVTPPRQHPTALQTPPNLAHVRRAARYDGPQLFFNWGFRMSFLRSTALIFASLITLAPARAQPLMEYVPADAIFYAGWRGAEELGPAYETSHLK